MKKTVAVVTGTRAEYGLLRRVIGYIADSDKLSLSLLVTGTHLSAAFGNTVTEIEKDGYPIAAKIDILKFGDGELATAKTVAYTTDAFARWFDCNKPDAVLVLGDRYEIFAVAAAAAMLRIPLIHISGGDVTKGAADDYFRHCITKMANLHFPSCAQYANRVIALGEPPHSVHNVGGLGDENIRKLALLPKAELAQSLGFSLDLPYCLVTYHPETLSDIAPSQQFCALLAALTPYLQTHRFIFTKANADAGGAKINALIDSYVQQHQSCIAFTSMGVLRYLSAMKYAAAVIGNSSSGVVETPTFGVPTLNIGNRQAGRIMCQNVLCCGSAQSEIEQGLQTIFTQSFYQKAHETVSPYNGGDTAKKIVQLTTDFLYSTDCAKPKEFFDVKQEHPYYGD
ncbi:MAG: UDP-N-acetylglucosamine 2-epimerase [Oscillospiraceae bacterium]|nr:UDP-N-acetylglucosamine 2-epimerase [Oscillospiraceae bacterium]